MTITRTDNAYRINFRYNPNIVAAIKAMPERRFDAVNKCWFVPLSSRQEIERFAQRFGFVFNNGTQQQEIVGEIPPLPELTTEIPLAREPYPYQKNGIAYCLDKKRCIIGDKPGLGKTGQAIATIIGAESYPCLIVCPSTLKINWQREVDLWSGGRRKAIIIDDNNRRTYHLFHEAGLADFYIVNYESLKKYFVEGFTNKEGQRLTVRHIKFSPKVDLFKSLVIDESHRCKNGTAQQSKFCMGIAKGKEYVLLLTGTPVINKPKDLVPQLVIMDRLGDLGGYQYFMKRYCEGRDGAANLRELNYRLSLSCFYQREKSAVLKDLPAKMRQTMVCEISNRKEYADAERNLIEYLRQYKNASETKIASAMRGQVIVLINVLRQIAARGKVAAVRDFLSDYAESGEKVILFMNLIELGDSFKKLYPDAVLIRGGMSEQAKQCAVDRFQNDPSCKLAICNIKAAGVGLTLTASSNVVFVEFPWTYADCEQCEDRAHRIGQKDSVNCFYFLGRDTIDEKIYKIIQTKKDVANTITGSTEQVEEDVVNLVADLFSQNT